MTRESLDGKRICRIMHKRMDKIPKQKNGIHWMVLYNKKKHTEEVVITLACTEAVNANNNNHNLIYIVIIHKPHF